MSVQHTSSSNKGLCSRCISLDISTDTKLGDRELGSLQDISQRQAVCDLCFLVFQFVLQDLGSNGLPDELGLYTVKLTQLIEWRYSWEVNDYENNLLDVHKKGDGPSFSGHENRGWAVSIKPELDFDEYTYGRRISRVAQETWPRDWQQFRQRLLRPDRVDFDRVREWYGLCCEFHKERCARPGWLATQPAPTLLRVIDINARAVVDAPEACCYTALSYVWGTSESQYVLKESDLSHLPHKLPSRLPQTIEDAIIVTRELGIQYLWVDVMCVAQLPEVNGDKTHQLGSMGSIFTFAEVSILAVACEDAESGIEGVRSRQANNISRIVNGEHLAVSQIQLEQDREGTSWSSRGWTFQESRLARRVLAFGPKQAYWVCQCDKWYESVILEPVFPLRPDFTNKLLPDTSRPPERVFKLYKYGFYSDKIEQDNHVLNAYVHLVSFYTVRKLGRPHDGLYAVTGMLKLLQNIDKTHLQVLHYGLPEECLDMALLWVPKSCLQRPTYNKRQQQIPSWSWAGWSSSVGHGVWWDTSAYGYGYLITIAPVIRWYIVAQDGSMRAINEYVRSRSDWWDHNMSDAPVVPCGMHPSRSLQEEPPAITGVGIPNEGYFLRCLTTTSSNYFYMGQKFKDYNLPDWPMGAIEPHVLIDKHGNISGFIRPPDDGLSLQHSGKPLDFIFIAYSQNFHDWVVERRLDETCEIEGMIRKFLRSFKWTTWCILDVMWVDRNHGGHAERISVAKILQDAWLSANPTTEWITLG